jgi:eukaryotic-like serine/threonine-protein kinase
MESRSQTDDLAMTLVEEALSRPEGEREYYLRSACGADTKLFAQAWSYVQWEKRMESFLLDPAYLPLEEGPKLEPGQLLINRFRVIREIARGGMGIVWEGVDEKLDRRVALKCAKAGFGKQLPPEVRNAREISHPNVCKIFEIHTASTAEGEIDFISMEFIEGETLAERIRRGPIPEPQARAIARQLCSGLAEAHRNRLIHGDFKTNNVILTTDTEGSVRAIIMDFGLARRAGASAAVVGGTPAYMAPELWKGEKPSVASDIYALGVVLWEIHSGQRPSQVSVSSSTWPITTRSIWKPPTGRGTWERIVARCLDPVPKHRFRSAIQVAEEFEPSAIRKWVAVGAAGVLLAAGAGLVTYWDVTAPTETVQLALLPSGSKSEARSASGTMLSDTAKRLDQLKSSSDKRFSFIPLDKATRNLVSTPAQARTLGASHSLQVSTELHGQGTVVHAFLTDLHGGMSVKEWKTEYKPGEIRYAPVAIAGFVTDTLGLPPPVEGSRLNDAARKDYLAGVAAARHDSGADEALRRFERAVAEDHDSALTYAGLAEAQWLKAAVTGDKAWLNRMAESVRAAENRNPDLPEVHRVAGLLKANSGWYGQAIPEYLRAISLRPRDGDAYRRLGEAYESNEQVEDALAAFRKAAEIDPKQYRNHRDLGDFFYQQARYQEAVKHLAKAVELAPDEPHAHYGLGAAYLGLGQFASAEQELRSSIRLRETPAAIQSLAVVLMYERKEREAIPYFLRALQLGPQRYLCWVNLGTAYRRLRRQADSERAYRRALDLVEQDIADNPRNGEVRADLGYLCAQLKDRRRARSEIAQALQQSPNDALIRWMAVATYEALGDRDDALALLASSPAGVLADINRWPDVANLRADPRFTKLLETHPSE